MARSRVALRPAPYALSPEPRAGGMLLAGAMLRGLRFQPARAAAARLTRVPLHGAGLPPAAQQSDAQAADGAQALPAGGGGGLLAAPPLSDPTPASWVGWARLALGGAPPLWRGGRDARSPRERHRHRPRHNIAEGIAEPEVRQINAQALPGLQPCEHAC